MIIQFRLKKLIADRAMAEGKKITYRHISEATGISTNTLTLMANNRMKQVGLTTLERLCNYFDCVPGDLISGTKNGHQ